MSNNKSILDKPFFDFIYLITSFFMIILLIVVLYNATSYWGIAYPHLNTFKEQMFYVAVLIVIVTSCAEWIEGRLTAIIRTLNKYKGGRKT